MTAQGSLDMLRRLATFAACVVFLGVVPTGSLFVTTLPTGADVWVDGTYVGRSPVFADALAAGRHTIGLARAGWAAQQVEATVVAGQTTLSALRLEPAQPAVPLAGGTLAIHGVDVLAVTIDGVAVARGKDGTYPASAGSHELSVRTAHGKFTRAVTVWPQTRTDVVLQTTAVAVRPSVVAPADDYLAPGAILIDGDKIVIHAPGHEATAHLGSTTYRLDGRTLDYASPPALIGQRLYLPIDFLTALTATAR